MSLTIVQINRDLNNYWAAMVEGGLRKIPSINALGFTDKLFIGPKTTTALPELKLLKRDS